MASKSKKKGGSNIDAAVGTNTGIVTLGDLARDYIHHLEEVGKSAGTIFSYKMDLDLALAEIGEGVPLVDIGEARVQAFYESARVLTKKTGAPKSKLTIDKTRRVLRLALVWAVQKGWLAEAPLPKPAAAAA